MHRSVCLCRACHCLVAAASPRCPRCQLMLPTASYTAVGLVFLAIGILVPFAGSALALAVTSLW